MQLIIDLNTGVDEDTEEWHKIIPMGSAVDNWTNTPLDGTSQF